MSRPSMRPRRAKLALALFLLPVLLLGTRSAAASGDPCALPRLAGGEAEGLGGTGLGDEPEGLGGTGFGEEGDGLGGTGFAFLGGDEEDSGIGGTGLGVYGAVTAFGSICVNGLRITYDAGTPTLVNGVAASAASLEIGHVVAVQASRGADPAAAGALVAERIALRQLVRGPLEAIEPDGALRVLGQRVVPPVDAGAAARFEPGSWLAVSGLRRADGSVAASRIDRIEGVAPGAAVRVSTIGRFERAGDGRVRVAGTAVSLAAEVDEEGEDGSAAPQARLDGEEVLASGVWNAEAQRIEDARVEAALAFDPDRTAAVSVGGYVESVAQDQSLRVGAFRIDPKAAGREVRVDDYIVIRGTLGTRGRVRVERMVLDARPPRVLIPRPVRPPRADAARPSVPDTAATLPPVPDRPVRPVTPAVKPPALPPRPPAIERIDRPRPLPAVRPQ